MIPRTIKQPDIEFQIFNGKPALPVSINQYGQWGIWQFKKVLRNSAEILIVADTDGKPPISCGNKSKHSKYSPAWVPVEAGYFLIHVFGNRPIRADLPYRVAKKLYYDKPIHIYQVVHIPLPYQLHRISRKMGLLPLQRIAFSKTGRDWNHEPTIFAPYLGCAVEIARIVADQYGGKCEPIYITKE